MVISLAKARFNYYVYFLFKGINNAFKPKALTLKIILNGCFRTSNFATSD